MACRTAAASAELVATVTGRSAPGSRLAAARMSRSPATATRTSLWSSTTSQPNVVRAGDGVPIGHLPSGACLPGVSQAAPARVADRGGRRRDGSCRPGAAPVRCAARRMAGGEPHGLVLAVSGVDAPRLGQPVDQPQAVPAVVVV